jgi:hypothetical protein
VPIGRQTQASELELQGRAISSADGLPPLLLLGREFTHEQAEGMGNRMQREEGRVGSSDWPKKPPARTCPARISTSSLCILLDPSKIYRLLGRILPASSSKRHPVK